jgi:hypothetical protein
MSAAFRDCPQCKVPRKVTRVETIENGKKIISELENKIIATLKDIEVK